MSPFEVRITLRTPGCIRPDLTLDAVLAAALFRLHGDVERAHREIPLQNTDGVWHGSRVRFLQGEFAQARYVARLSHRDFDPAGYSGAENRKGEIRINIGGGDLSPQVRNLPVFAGSIAFDACGDAQAVEDLLWQLRGIGKNVRQGWGRVAQIQIHPQERDTSVRDANDEPCRPVPAELWRRWGLDAGRVITDEAGWRPAYWNNANRCLCVLPR